MVRMLKDSTHCVEIVQRPYVDQIQLVRPLAAVHCSKALRNQIPKLREGPNKIVVLHSMHFAIAQGAELLLTKGLLEQLHEKTALP